MKHFLFLMLAAMSICNNCIAKTNTTAASDTISLGKDSLNIATSSVKPENEKSYLKDSLTLTTSLVKPGDEVRREVKLQEVVVKGKEIVVKDDRLIIYPSSKIKKHSIDGYSALSLLSVPGLHVDPIEESVTTNGEATLLCINGREADRNEIKTLYPKDIIRIDYYQRYDPNHPSAKSVIDFIVRIREHGGMAMGQVNQNLNKASGNDIADLKMFHGRSQLNIQLTGKYDHFTPSRGTESYTFMPFSGGDVEKSIVTKPSDIHTNNAGISLAYLYTGTTSMLQIAASLRKNHNAKGTLQEQTLTGFGTIDSKDLRHNDNTSPTFKLYYKNNFTKKFYLQASINANYNHTNQWRDYKATQEYLTHTKEDHYYLVPQILANYKPRKNVTAFLLATYYYSHSDNTYIENGDEITNSLTEGQAIIMQGCSWQVIPKKFKLTFQLQERIQTIDIGSKSKTKIYLTPSLGYDIKLSKTATLFGSFYTGVNSPEIKYYNSGERRIDEHQVMAGSKEQKTGRLFTTEHSLNGGSKWGGFQIYLRYENNQKEIYEDIRLDESRKLYVHQFLHGGTYEKFDIVGNIQLNLIPDKLKFLNATQYKYMKWQTGHLNTLDTWINTTELTWYDKGWQCKVSYVTERKGFSKDGGVTKYPHRLTLSAGYTSGNWSFNLSARNPSMTSYLADKFQLNGYKRFSKAYNPRNDYDMFAMRVSYRLVYGKKHKYQEVQMDDTYRSAILE